MNYPAAELRGIKMTFCLINPDAEHRGILLIKVEKTQHFVLLDITEKSTITAFDLEKIKYSPNSMKRPNGNISTFFRFIELTLCFNGGLPIHVLRS